MKIAFIHNNKRIGTGAHYINDLIAAKLRQKNVSVKNFYPKDPLMDSPTHMRGLANILFFYNLIEHRREILRYSAIQGTTYTPLPFLALPIPVVTHFGSTTAGFLKNTPLANKIEKSTGPIWYELKKNKVISEVNVRTRRPLRDIAEIEHYAAAKATAVIATSEKVKQELIGAGVRSKRIEVIHNAIEDYWFNAQIPRTEKQPQIVFLGRLGQDVFTLKLKGLDRLIHLYRRFPEIKKTTICMTTNKNLKNWMKRSIKNHTVYTNLRKDLIPNVLRSLAGSILFIPSRYEGFSLSLVEGMSQGLIPVTYPVGIAPEIIENGRNGFIVKSQSEAVRRVRQLLHDEPLREYMSQRALRTAGQFKSEFMADRLRRFYAKLLGRGSKKRLK